MNNATKVIIAIAGSFIFMIATIGFVLTFLIHHPTTIERDNGQCKSVCAPYPVDYVEGDKCQCVRIANKNDYLFK